MEPGGTRDDGALAAGIGGLPALAGMVVLVGVVLPLSWGLLLPLGACAVATLIVEWRSRAVSAWVRERGGLGPALSRLRFEQRVAVAALTILPAAVFLTVGVRVIAALWMAFPASLWATAAFVIVSGAVVLLPTSRSQLPAALAVAAVVAGAALWGARCEAEAPDARGWAQSGPIHGIHAFQSAAVVIDGYGPFDIPINDFVEPDGSRGYGPPEFADAVQRALHEIAQLQFADGPARARQAFAQARAGHGWTDPVPERLDRPGRAEEQPRFWVESGTYGQRSRVEFVCPGSRVDPDGPPRDSVMSLSCPSKYASEGSAGLGITGRWPGYAEVRGNERVSLAKLVGWTRSDDAVGRAVQRKEQRALAWAVLLACVLLALAPRGRLAQGVLAAGGGVAAVAFAALVWLAISGAQAVAGPGLVETPTAPIDALDLRPWIPALLILSGLPWLQHRGAPPQSSRWRRLVVAALVVGTVAAAAHLGALEFSPPVLWPQGDGLTFEATIIAWADAAGSRGDILTVESVIASAVAAVLLAMCVGLVRAVALVSEGFEESPVRRRYAGVIGAALVGLVCVGLVVSRKTEGAATLIPGATGLMLILGSGLLAQAGSRGRRRVAAHLAWTALAVALLFVSAAASATGHPFVLLCVGAGLIAAVLGLTLMRPPDA